MGRIRRSMAFTLGVRRCVVHTGTRTMPRVVQSTLAATATLAALALPSAAAGAPGTLDYRQKLDSSRGIYIEGSISFVRVRAADGEVVVRRRTAKLRFRMVRKLPPGRY